MVCVLLVRDLALDYGRGDLRLSALPRSPGELTPAGQARGGMLTFGDDEVKAAIEAETVSSRRSRSRCSPT